MHLFAKCCAVDHESILDVGLEHAFVRRVDLVRLDVLDLFDEKEIQNQTITLIHTNVAIDLMLGAELQHRNSLGDAADQRTDDCLR